MANRREVLAQIREIRASLPHPRPSKPSEVLENALAYLTPKGRWGQGFEFNPSTGEACLIGALHIGDGGVVSSVSDEAVWFSPSATKSKAKVYFAAKRYLLDRIDNVTVEGFNDHSARSKGQITRLLRAALKRAQREGN